MATRILLVSLFLSLLVACDKKEDDINPGKVYSGSLTLNYSRTFPTFSSNVGFDVSITGNGEVNINNPGPVLFDGISEKLIEGVRVKIREHGTIEISSISGTCSRANGKDYLEVSLSCKLDGIQEVWNYQENQWVSVSEAPYQIQHPVSTPMMFRIENAVMDEAVCGGFCSDCWGNSCYRWRLILTETE